MLTRILPARRTQTSSLLPNSHHIRDAASAENGICWGELCRRAALSPGTRGREMLIPSDGILPIVLDEHYVGIEIVDLRVEKITAIGGNG